MEKDEIQKNYDQFFGTGYWEKELKLHITKFAEQCVRTALLGYYKPLAYLTGKNKIWMQDPKDEDRYIPNPNAEGSYHYTYCEEIGCIPLYDPKLIERCIKLKEDGWTNKIP